MAATAKSVTEEQTIGYARERLEEWGQWLRNLRGVRLGYASHAACVIERVDNDHSEPALPMDDASNERAEEIEAIMCRLAERAQSLHRALVEWYAVGSTQDSAAQACGCSVSMYKALRKTGEMWVAARLLG